MKMVEDKKYFEALFLLSGMRVMRMYEIPNEYWPETCTEMRARHPWQLVMTEAGPIKIGWRKRVISINWEDTPIRAIVTDDNVTSGETYVHAWSYLKALEYLTKLEHERLKAYTPRPV